MENYYDRIQSTNKKVIQPHRADRCRRNPPGIGLSEYPQSCVLNHIHWLLRVPISQLKVTALAVALVVYRLFIALFQYNSCFFAKAVNYPIHYL